MATTTKLSQNGTAAVTTINGNGNCCAKDPKGKETAACEGEGDEAFFRGFGTLAIQAGQRPERWNMNQVLPRSP
jgi:hypothetical protein